MDKFERYEFESSYGDWYMEKDKSMSFLDDAISYFRKSGDKEMLDKMLDVQSFVKDTECR